MTGNRRSVIQGAIDTDDVDQLKLFAIHGYIDNGFRRRVWPLLFVLDRDAFAASFIISV
jgi:hypothetical protein